MKPTIELTTIDKNIEKSINKSRKDLFTKIVKQKDALNVSNTKLGYLIQTSTSHVTRLMSGDHSIDLLTLLRLLVVLKLRLVVNTEIDTLTIDVENVSKEISVLTTQ